MKLLGQRLPRALEAFLRERRTVFARRADRLAPEPLLRRTAQARTAIDQLDRRRDQAIGLLLERIRRRGQELERLMRTLSYESVLERGFAIVFDAEGNPIKQATSVSEGDALSIRFRDGDVSATVGETPGTPSSKGPARKTSSSRPGGQGSLF